MKILGLDKKKNSVKDKIISLIKDVRDTVYTINTDNYIFLNGFPDKKTAEYIFFDKKKKKAEIYHFTLKELPKVITNDLLTKRVKEVDGKKMLFIPETKDFSYELKKKKVEKLEKEFDKHKQYYLDRVLRYFLQNELSKLGIKSDFLNREFEKIIKNKKFELLNKDFIDEKLLKNKKINDLYKEVEKRVKNDIL